MRPQDVPEIVRSRSAELQFNAEAIDIMDGNLSPYLDKLLQQQLSLQSYWQAKQRMSPINVLPKIIDKLTNIYQTSVIRTTDKESDQKLVDYYVKQVDMNSQLNCANELFNLCGATLLQPYVYNMKPYLRPIPNDKFVVYSENHVQPNKPTHVILIYGPPEKKIYWVFSAEEIYATDGRDILIDLMRAKGMESTVNEIGRLPFTYVNSAKYKLCPTPDQDGLTICKLLPVMITDLNHAAMFQCFSILYMINATDQALQYAPNAVWQLNTNPATPDLKPEIGSIKPQVDYDQVLKLIESQLSMWLGTKGIRASTIGGLTQENFASGVSKIIDEMDTFESRQKQVNYFTNGEADMWDLIANYLHPYWVSTGQIENVGMFSPNAQVATTFAVQLPMQSRGQVVKDLQTEVAAGFISRQRAIAKLNPQMTEKEIAELITEIDEELNATTKGEDTDTGGPEAGAEDTTSRPGDRAYLREDDVGEQG